MDEKIYFARHYQLAEFGEQKQNMLRQAKVLVIGAGGLGCPVLQYLSASGVGHITVIDGDAVSASNLHRQVLYTVSDIGLKKVDVLPLKLNTSFCKLETIDAWLDADLAKELFPRFDLIVDTSDNFATRYLVNDYCVEFGKALVSAGIQQYGGQLSVYNYQLEDGMRSGTYRCLFPEVDMDAPNCTNDGVLSTAVGVLGLLQANEVIKVLTKDASVLANKLLLYNVRSNEQRIVKYRRVLDAGNKEFVQPENALIGITWEELREWDVQSKPYLLVDVREEWEHEEGNRGGINIPLGDIIREVGKFANEARIVFYCKRSERSRIAIQRLQSKGLANEMFYVIQ